jgi:predicted phosphoribosyltransferase
MESTERFRDRADAGRALAALLTQYANRTDVLILALPRGGVPVAFAVAEALQAPLDVFLVRKLGAPGEEELAMGAIASGNVVVLNGDVIRALAVPNAVVEQVAAAERHELERRERAYRDDRPPADVRGRTVILVDDGLATGSTMRAAIVALRRLQPARLVTAVPVGAPEVCRRLRADLDDLVCARTPASLYAIGAWFEDFSQTTDQEVRDLLARAEHQTKIAPSHTPLTPTSP